MKIKFIEDCPLLASDGNPCIRGIHHIHETRNGLEWYRKCESYEQLIKFLKRLKREVQERR